MTSWRSFAVPVLAALLTPAAGGAAEKNYILTIEGKDYPAAPGDNVTVRLKSGEDVMVKFRQNENSIYETEQYSFSLPASVRVEVTNVEDAVLQRFAVTENGTAIVVQHHVEVDDESMTAVRDIYLNNLLRGPIAKGVKITRSEISRRLHDGKEIKGVRSMFVMEKNDVTIAAYTMRRGAGALMFVTIFNKNTAPGEGVIIDQFWDTLRVKG